MKVTRYSIDFKISLYYNFIQRDKLMEFKDRLKDLRQNKNITQKELAKKIFVSRSAIAKWENGLGIPSDANMKMLCDFFSVDENWLLDKKDLKGEIKLSKLQKRNIVISILGIIIPIIFILFSIAPLYHYNYETGKVYIWVYYAPASMFSLLGALWGTVGYIIWGATVIFSILSISVPQLKKFTEKCFWVNVVLLVLSVLIFIVLIVISTFLAGQIDYKLIF